MFFKLVGYAMANKFFIFGYGYTARYLTQTLTDQEYIGTSSQNSCNDNVQIIAFDHPQIEVFLAQSSYILVSIPPTVACGDLVLAKYAALLQKYAGRVKWLGYLSSTGVYGDYNGSFVDETSPCKAQGPSGQLRLAAETNWLNFARKYNLPLHIFRIAGIYGPGRNVLERIKNGNKKFSIYKKDQYFSRIHVADIAQVISASIKRPNPFNIYNVADDIPAPSHEVDAYACALLKMPELRQIAFTDAKMSPMEQEFYNNNKRVSNIKITNELHVKLLYPSYIEGLSKII
jgi:nucleoside-diphosphate-sugar epimerase